MTRNKTKEQTAWVLTACDDDAQVSVCLLTQKEYRLLIAELAKQRGCSVASLRKEAQRAA